MKHQEIASMIWRNADLLRNDYKPTEYGRIIIPMFLLRRIECVIADTREAVAETAAEEAQENGGAPEGLLTAIAGREIWNSSKLTLDGITRSNNKAEDMQAYINSFNQSTREIFERMDFFRSVDDLSNKNLLGELIRRFASFDLSNEAAGAIEEQGNQLMGHVFEELILKFQNPEDGEFFTPREVIKLAVKLLISGDKGLGQAGIVRSVYDGTAGSGGMLAFAEDGIKEMRPDANVRLAGQEINAFSSAMARADLLVRGQNGSAIALGDTLREDLHINEQFDFVLMNPPYGVDWSKSEAAVREENKLGFAGRFGPGLPRKSDGSLLFILHGLSKLRPVHITNDQKSGGGRMGVILSASPLFSGGAGSGESEIRRYLFENDLIEAIVALPTEIFTNTGIQTYLWILTNNKEERRRGKVQLIDASKMGRRMRKSMGSKRNELTTYETPDEQGMALGSRSDIGVIQELWSDFEQSDPKVSKVFENRDFGYRTITVERPLRLRLATAEEAAESLHAHPKLSKDDHLPQLEERTKALLEQAKQEEVRPSQVLEKIKSEAKALRLNIALAKAWGNAMTRTDAEGEVILDKNQQPISDPEIRDTEDVPLTEDVQAYFEREVLSHTPDAWINTEVIDEKDGLPGKVGYEIPFNRYFYTYEAPPSLQEVNARILERSTRIMEMLKEIIG